MHSKDYPRENRKPRERRRPANVDSPEETSRSVASQPDVKGDCKYRIGYGKGGATLTVFTEGSRKTANYNGRTHKWDAHGLHMPDFLKGNIEAYYPETHYS